MDAEQITSFPSLADKRLISFDTESVAPQDENLSGFMFLLDYKLVLKQCIEPIYQSIGDHIVLAQAFKKIFLAYTIILVCSSSC